MGLWFQAFFIYSLYQAKLTTVGEGALCYQTIQNEQMLSNDCCGYIRPHSNIFTLFIAYFKVKIKIFKDLESKF
jgi:hypothetical protein